MGCLTNPAGCPQCDHGRRPVCVGTRRGWRCIREGAHDGPCALMPRWWNLRRLAELIRWR